MSDPLDDMYREIILDHYKAPRGKKPLDDKDIESDGHNPSCGDELTMQLKVDKGNIVQDVHVDCKGCAISVASGSMLAEYIKGKPLDDVKRISEAIKKMLKGALLAWMTLIEGVKNFETGTKPGTFTVSTEDDKKE